MAKLSWPVAGRINKVQNVTQQQNHDNKPVRGTGSVTKPGLVGENEKLQWRILKLKQQTVLYGIKSQRPRL